MTDSPSGRLSVASVALLALVLSATLMPVTSSGASADEISHENYDLVSTDLGVVITMLSSSIEYSELALMCMYNRTMAFAEQNLSAVRSILVPAEGILEQIDDVASSYENLSTLIPPFVELSALMDGFAYDEKALLETLAELADASELPALTGDELIAALDAIKRGNELIVKMNGTIDYMLATARDIANLQVDGERPFADSQLIALTERLRDLLASIEKDLAEVIDQDLPLDEAGPFLLLWVSSPSYYLGDTMIGGGYLFFDGAFAPGYTVNIVFDGSLLTSAMTSVGGKFSFTHEIPLNVSWVGTHTLSANSTTRAGLLESDTLSVRISLIPTATRLVLSAGTIAIQEIVIASVTIMDVGGNPLESDACLFTVDGEVLAFETGPDGKASRTWQGAQLGYGRHSIRAFYEGETYYAPSSSAIRVVTVDIPTSLDLSLSSKDVQFGERVVGNGTLRANDTERLANQKISLFLDDVLAMNLTTDEEGGFAFALSSENLTSGGHILRAAFLDRDIIYRYSQDEESFTIGVQKEESSPFWPIIPGWGDVPGDLIESLLFGKNAIFFWLLLLAFAGVTVRTLQMRKRAAALAGRDRSEELEPIDSGMRASGDVTDPPEDHFELPPPGEGPANPNERIVWHYQRFLAFLTRRGWPGLRASMTHREVARALKAWGYPHESVEDATALFERAMYSGVKMTDEDAVHMSAAMTGLVRPGGRKGARDAV